MKMQKKQTKCLFWLSSLLTTRNLESKEKMRLTSCFAVQSTFNNSPKHLQLSAIRVLKLISKLFAKRLYRHAYSSLHLQLNGNLEE